MSIQSNNNNNNNNASIVAQREGSVYELDMIGKTCIVLLSNVVFLYTPFFDKASLDSFFNLFGDSRDEARRILDEYTRATSQPLLRAERFQQLQDLYTAAVPVNDFHLVQLVNAIVDASHLHCANVLLPGIRVLDGNQTANSDSSLTASAGTNSNQQESTFGGEVHAENTEVESSSAMSFIAARDLFPTSD
jgi:hypothetical protein